MNIAIESWIACAGVRVKILSFHLIKNGHGALQERVVVENLKLDVGAVACCWKKQEELTVPYVCVCALASKNWCLMNSGWIILRDLFYYIFSLLFFDFVYSLFIGNGCYRCDELKRILSICQFSIFYSCLRSTCAICYRFSSSIFCT